MIQPALNVASVSQSKLLALAVKHVFKPSLGIFNHNDSLNNRNLDLDLGHSHCSGPQICRHRHHRSHFVNRLGRRISCSFQSLNRFRHCHYLGQLCQQLACTSPWMDLWR